MDMHYPFDADVYAPARALADVLRGADDILVTAHASPDGDALGATYALARGLMALGKRVALCNATGAPEYLAWLPAPGVLHATLEELPFAPRLAVVLDCGDAARLGRMLAPAIATLPTINIDHHVGNPLFGTVANWVEPRMAATGQMVAAVLHALGVPLEGALADAIYVAVSTDTGNFSFENTSAEVFALMGHLVQMGLHVAPLRQQIDNQWPLSKMLLWGKALEGLTLHEGGRVALVALTQADIEACDARREDGEGLVEHVRRLRGVDMAVFVREDAPERCKISLRSQGPINVQAVAAVFGGGGHVNAAGATLELPFAQTVEATLAAAIAGLPPINPLDAPAHIG